MKFRFPVIIIDEDFRAENISGSGIRDLAEAIQKEGMDVTGNFVFPSSSLTKISAPRTSRVLVFVTLPKRFKKRVWTSLASPVTAT